MFTILIPAAALLALLGIVLAIWASTIRIFILGTVLWYVGVVGASALILYDTLHIPARCAVYADCTWWRVPAALATK